VNQVNVHLFVESMPFGGVGSAGIGHYYGKYGFDMLTHAKSMLISNPMWLSNIFPAIHPEKNAELKVWFEYKPMVLARLKSVAGVMIPDTALCKAAIDLLESSSPGFSATIVCELNFWKRCIQSIGRSVADEEAAFLCLCATRSRTSACLPSRQPVRGGWSGCRSPILPRTPGATRARRPRLEGNSTSHITRNRNSPGSRNSIGASRRRARIVWPGPQSNAAQMVEEVLQKYPRMDFKTEFRNLLVEHCRHNPAVQVLNWTDDVARTAGCTLQGRPIPTASQLMSVAPYEE